MIASIVIFWLLCIGNACDRLQPMKHTVQPKYNKPIDAFWFYRDELNRTRSRRVFLEDSNKMIERHMKAPDLFTPELEKRTRKHMEQCNREIESMKGYERVLEWWEQQRKVNPGLDTDGVALQKIQKVLRDWGRHGAIALAPMPREVKQ